jgi:flavin reductase (DIM6/NTAB) family NADH-FMN oxidoreductase RutF
VSRARSGSAREPPEDGQSDGIDQLLFRDVLASFPAGVVIVTAMGEGYEPAGVTVSSFCSVSARPTLILVCIDESSRTLSAIRFSGTFTVNILAAGREELALLFASKGDDKFRGVAWEEPQADNGGPILRQGAAAYLACSVQNEVEAGDHRIFIGLAVEAGMQTGHPHLLYHKRSFSSAG